MSLIVCKFGGSSLCDAEMFMRVRRIIDANPDRRYIILSAPGRRSSGDDKITDLLLRLCDGSNCHQSIFSRIYQRYAAIRDHLVPEFDLEAEFEHIRGGMPQTTDFILSRGEYLCARLFAAYMDWPFIDAARLFFFSEDGNIDPAKTREQVRRLLLPLGRAVIPGFYGLSPRCGVRTFTRGGSDVSGALTAAALDADLYENWTDVDGLFTADPRIAADARRHSIVSLAQMERIARSGAELLHPDALMPLRGRSIDVLLKNTRRPNAQGTVIREGFDRIQPCVTGRRRMYFLPSGDGRTPLITETPVTGSSAVAVISAYGLAEALLDTVRTAVNPIHIIHMQDHIQIIIEEGRYDHAVQKIHAIMTDNASI